MADHEPVTLAPEVRDDRLGSGGIGVLAFAGSDGDPPHAIPVSYGYDAIHETFYFRLAMGEGSEKGDVADRPVTFVTYGDGGDGWWSIVARGRLEPTDREGVAVESLAGLDRVENTAGRRLRRATRCRHVRVRPPRPRRADDPSGGPDRRVSPEVRAPCRLDARVRVPAAARRV